VKNLLFIIFLLTETGICRLHAQQAEFFNANNRQINVQQFNAEMEKMIENSGVPAISLAVIDNNKVSYFHTYGYKQLAEKVQVNDETIFEGASLSKSYLIYVAYKLVDEGRLDLDRPMYLYLRNKRLEYDSRYLLITPRMILNHSSGLENWEWDNDPKKLEIVAEPGTSFTYSGEGYGYLADVVDSMLHKPYKQYIEDIVLKPLGLNRSFSSFNNSIPDNYAIGHDNLGKELEKWKPDFTIPASGMNFTARDYATLVAATFDKRHISERSIKQILVRATRLDKEDSTLYYGPGYEVIFANNDTIIGQGGNNLGFKSQMYYSIPCKCGFVFLTNSDLGLSLIEKINELTVGLNIHASVEKYPWSQYPSAVSVILKMYKKNKNMDEVVNKIEEMEHRAKGRINAHELSELGWIFTPENITVAKRLLEDNIKLYPDYSLAYYFLGELNIEMKNYQVAYNNLSKAKELNLTLVPVDPELKKCTDLMNHTNDDKAKNKEQ
jgi:CubicO group peptidase (beta-lactamase class C family)